MKIRCPNKNLAEWKKLEEDIGSEQAYIAYFRNNGAIPSKEDALVILEQIKIPVIDKMNPKNYPEDLKAAVSKRAKDLQGFEEMTRAKANFLSNASIMEAANLRYRVAEATALGQFRVEKMIEIQKAILDYAKRIGLDNENLKYVSSILKNTRTAEGLSKALDHMDDIMRKRTNRKLVRVTEKIISRERKRLKSAMSGAKKDTFDYKTNTRMKEYIDGLASVGPKSRESVKESLDWFSKNPDKEIPADVQKSIVDLFKNNLQTMNNEQLLGIISDIGQIKELGYLKRKLLKIQKERKERVLIQEAVAEIGVPEKKSPMAKIKRDEGGAISKAGESISDIANKYKNAVLTAETIIESLTNKFNNKKSSLKELIFTGIRKASEKKQENLDKTIRDIKAIFEKNKVNYFDVIKKKISVQNDVFDSKGRKKGEETRSVPLDEAMFIYAHSQNDSGLAHLRATYSDKAIESAIEQLPQNYKDAVDQTITYYDDVIYPRLNEVFKRTHNIDMPKESRYFPITNLDSKRVETATMEDMLVRHGARIGIQYGAINARVKSENPFTRSSFMGTVQKHTRDTEHYIAMIEAVNEARKYLENPEIKAAIDEKDKGAYKALRDWMADNAFGRIEPAKTPLGRAADFIRKNTVTSIFGLNVLVAAKQPISLLPAIPYVGSANLTRSLAMFSTHPFKMMEFVYSKSVFMKYRAESIEREMAEMTDAAKASFLTGGKNWDKAKEFFTTPVRVMDQLTATTVWVAAYSKNFKNTKNESSAIEYADYVVRKTQSTGDLVNMPSIYRTAGWERMFTMFTSALNKNANIIYSAYKDKETTKGKALSILFWTLLASGLAEYMISHLSANPKTWLKDDPEGVARSIIQQGTVGLPFFGDFLDAGMAGLRNYVRESRGANPDFSEFDAAISAPTLDVYQDLSTTLSKAPAMIAGKGTGAQYLTALKLASKLVGFPSLGTKAIQAIAKKDPLVLLTSQRAKKDLSVEAYEKERGMPMTDDVREYLSNRKNRSDMAEKEIKDWEERVGKEMSVTLKNIRKSLPKDLSGPDNLIRTYKKLYESAVKRKDEKNINLYGKMIEFQAKRFNKNYERYKK